MHEHPAARDLAPWHIPVAVEDVSEVGKRFDLVADADVRARVARLAGLRELSRLEASFDVRRRGADGLHVTGRISASVGQTCVVTLEPVSDEVDEAVDVVFAPPQTPERVAGDAESSAAPREIKWDDPEPLRNGRIDLGALATEFLILGLDPYPRKADVEFQPPADGGTGEGPFAALAELRKNRDDH